MYDTPLSQEEEARYQAWKQRYAPNDSGDDYDLRGAFKAGLKPDAKSGHWPDTYKKPNHPTFSDESIYAKYGSPGHWEGEKYMPASKPWERNWGGSKPWERDYSGGVQPDAADITDEDLAFERNLEEQKKAKANFNASVFRRSDEIPSANPDPGAPGGPPPRPIAMAPAVALSALTPAIAAGPVAVAKGIGYGMGGAYLGGEVGEKVGGIIDRFPLTKKLTRGYAGPTLGFLGSLYGGGLGVMKGEEGVRALATKAPPGRVREFARFLLGEGEKKAATLGEIATGEAAPVATEAVAPKVVDIATKLPPPKTQGELIQNLSMLYRGDTKSKQAVLEAAEKVWPDEAERKAVMELIKRGNSAMPGHY